jgi:SAM-dependent methyltransferase
MKQDHLKRELSFYTAAYSDNATRRARGFFWGDQPNEVVHDLVESHQLIKPGFRVLDLGCGDGRHLAYFRSLGCSVTGVDFSQEAIGICEERFAGDDLVTLRHCDLTQPGALEGLGEFDLILDYSVIDHIRRRYLRVYVANLVGALKVGGHHISIQFAPGLPGVWKGRDYKLTLGGHYSRAFSAQALAATFPSLQAIEARENVILEQDIMNFPMTALLLRQP